MEYRSTLSRNFKKSLMKIGIVNTGYKKIIKKLRELGIRLK